MILAVDVHYTEDTGYAAGVLFHSWGDAQAEKEIAAVVNGIASYRPGQFYKRELPCLLALMEQLDEMPKLVIVDGYVYLDGERKRGLGYYLYEALGRKVPVVGVAKKRFKGMPDWCAVYRGESKNPLFVTAVSIPQPFAKTYVQSMAGEGRIPVLLKAVDKLCRASVKQTAK
ncbi:MAG: endonuclease V [Chloroflexota bacterium]